MKVKIVGKKLLALVLFMGVWLNAGIELRVTTLDGALLSQAGAGEPFLIEVTVSDTESTLSPHIKGLDSFQVRNAGIQIRSINGRSSVKHLYNVRIDTPGEFIIGPATVSLDSNFLCSNTVELRVGARQVAKEVHIKKRQEVSSALLFLKLNKKEVFVGEKVTAKLQFLYPDTVSLEHIAEPEFTDFSVGSKGGPITSSRTIDGTNYTVLTWHFDLYPKRSGKLIIPACSADFLIQSPFDRFAGFSFLFGPRTTRKRVYSNAVHINVLPLPPHDPPIEAIGAFTTYNAIIEPHIAKKGEGMVFSLCLEGEGNFDAIKIPVLQNMPDTFKYYDSKNYPVCGKDSDHQGHCFEYIIQGLEEGDWQIPAQEFTYFDTKRKVYRTLKTTPLHVSIIGQNNACLKPPQKENQADSKPQQGNNDSQLTKSEDELFTLNKDGAWYHIDNQPLSWYWFFIIVIVSLCYLLGYGINYARAYLNVHYALLVRRKQAFGNARKQLKEIVQIQDAVRLYHLFGELFAARLQIPTNAISQKLIEQKLAEGDWTEEQIIAWTYFFSSLVEQAYSTERQNKKELFDQAIKWLDRLERVI